MSIRPDYHGVARHGPDLVVDEIRVVGNSVRVTIRNAGNLPVLPTQEFFVDLYIDPRSVPTRVGQIWQELAPHGVAWGVTGNALPLAPGATLQLVTGGAYYWAEESHLPATIPESARLYAHVDSVDPLTHYGAVLERHEIAGGSYNNIAGPDKVVRSSVGVQLDEDVPTLETNDDPTHFGGPARH